MPRRRKPPALQNLQAFNRLVDRLFGEGRRNIVDTVRQSFGGRKSLLRALVNLRTGKRLTAPQRAELGNRLTRSRAAGTLDITFQTPPTGPGFFPRVIETIVTVRGEFVVRGASQTENLGRFTSEPFPVRVDPFEDPAVAISTRAKAVFRSEFLGRIASDRNVEQWVNSGDGEPDFDNFTVTTRPAEIVEVGNIDPPPNLRQPRQSRRRRTST